jgi:hypothetical protein
MGRETLTPVEFAGGAESIILAPPRRQAGLIRLWAELLGRVVEVAVSVCKLVFVVLPRQAQQLIHLHTHHAWERCVSCASFFVYVAECATTHRPREDRLAHQDPSRSNLAAALALDQTLPTRVGRHLEPEAHPPHLGGRAVLYSMRATDWGQTSLYAECAALVARKLRLG